MTQTTKAPTGDEAKPQAEGQPEAKSNAGMIVLKRLKDAIIVIPIVGLTPVIPHRWSEKSKRAMPGHPKGKTEAEKKGKRNPKREAEGCLYQLDGQLALPATAFKAAIVGACRFYVEPSMVEAKQLIFVEGAGPEQLVPIQGTKHLREDTPRNAGGNADLRYRYAIDGWSARLRIHYLASRITRESIIHLVDAAGRGGVGDWRPSAPKSKTGTFGTWRVDETKEITDVA